MELTLFDMSSLLTSASTGKKTEVSSGGTGPLKALHAGEDSAESFSDLISRHLSGTDAMPLKTACTTKDDGPVAVTYSDGSAAMAESTAAGHGEDELSEGLDIDVNDEITGSGTLAGLLFHAVGVTDETDAKKLDTQVTPSGGVVTDNGLLNGNMAGEGAKLDEGMKASDMPAAGAKEESAGAGIPLFESDLTDISSAGPTMKAPTASVHNGSSATVTTAQVPAEGNITLYGSAQQVDEPRAAETSKGGPEKAKAMKDPESLVMDKGLERTAESYNSAAGDLKSTDDTSEAKQGGAGLRDAISGDSVKNSTEAGVYAAARLSHITAKGHSADRAAARPAEANSVKTTTDTNPEGSTSFSTQDVKPDDLSILGDVELNTHSAVRDLKAHTGQGKAETAAGGIKPGLTVEAEDGLHLSEEAGTLEGGKVDTAASGVAEKINEASRYGKETVQARVSENAVKAPEVVSLTDNTTQAAGTQRSVQSQAGQPSTSAADSVKVFEKFDEALKLSVGRSGRDVRITLHPKELGSLQIRLNLDRNAVRARIAVESSVVKDIFDADAARMKEIFGTHGLSLEKYTVELVPLSPSAGSGSDNMDLFSRDSGDRDFSGEDGNRPFSSERRGTDGREKPQNAIFNNYGYRTGGQNPGGVDVFA